MAGLRLSQMVTLARGSFKSIAFIIILLFSISFIYAPLSLIPIWNQHYSLIVSELLGFHDIEMFDVIFGMSISLLIAISIYISLMKLYQRHLAKRKNASIP